MDGRQTMHSRMRVTVGMIVGMVASGQKESEILKLYSYLEAEDIRQSLLYSPMTSISVRSSH